MEVFDFIGIALKKVVPDANQTITLVQVLSNLSFFTLARVNRVEKCLILVVGKLNAPQLTVSLSVIKADSSN